MNPLIEKRRTYDQILWQVLEAYFRGCKREYQRARGTRGLHENISLVFDALYEEIEHEFKHPIELLMFHCFILALWLDTNKKADEYHKAQALQIIKTYGIENIRTYLSSEEILEVDDDLSKLGLLE